MCVLISNMGKNMHFTFSSLGDVNAYIYVFISGDENTYNKFSSLSIGDENVIMTFHLRIRVLVWANSRADYGRLSVHNGRSHTCNNRTSRFEITHTTQCSLEIIQFDFLTHEKAHQPSSMGNVRDRRTTNGRQTYTNFTSCSAAYII